MYFLYLMQEINYEDIVSQLKKELNTDIAIANRYGIVLASNINVFPKGKIIPNKILELISEKERKSIAEELGLEDINSFTFESQEHNYLFTFSKELILISKVNLDVNLAKFMPSIRVFTQKLSENYHKSELKDFSLFDFSKDIEKIEATLAQEAINQDKYEIIKDLIKYISG